MSILTPNIFSSSESEQLRDLLKNPEEDLQRLIELLQKKVEVETKKFKETEIKLRKSEQRFQSLIEQTTDAVFCYEYNPPIPINLPIDEQVKCLYDGVLVDCNLICARSYGADQVDDVIDRKLTDLFGTIPHSLDKLFRDLIKGEYRIIDGLGIEKLPNGDERYFLNNDHSVIENNKLVRIWGTFRDITDRKKAEETRYHEQDLIHTLLDNHPDFIYFKDSKARFQHLSKRFCEFFGRSMEDIIGKTDLELFPEEVAIQTHSEDLNIIKTGIPLINKEETDGETWVLSTKMPWFNKDGKVKGLFGISRDITELKKAEQKLKESEEKYRILVEQSLQGIIIIQDIKIVFANSAMAEILGYSVEELLRFSTEEAVKMMHPDDRTLVLDRHKDRMEGKTVPNHYEYRIIRKDHEIRTMEIYATVIEYEGKIASQQVFIDITDKKESEEKLKKSEERNRGLINNITDIIYELDFNGKCTYASDQLFDISGFYPDEMIGQNVFEFLHPDDFLNIAEKVKETFNSGKRISADFKLKHKKRYYVPVSSNFNMIDTKGDLRLIGVLRDNTEKKQAELKLRESEENFRNIAEQSFMGIEIIQDGEIKYVNDATSKILEYSIQEIKSWKYEELFTYVYSEDLPIIKELQKKRQKDKAPQIHYSIRAITKSGKIKWLEVSSKRVLYQGKEAIFAIFYDISERKEAELKLKESEEKFRSITEQSLMGIIIIQNGRVVYVNNAELNIMEYTEPEMLDWTQKEIFNHIHPDDKAKAIKRGREREEGKVLPLFFQYRLVTKSGKHKTVDVSTKNIEFNKEPANLTYVIDVTDKKEAEQKYENLINNLTDIILELDMKGNVSYVNHQCYDILGYQQSEIIGKTAFNFIYPEDISIIAESMKEAFSTKETISVLQYRLVHKNGDIIHASARGKYITVGGNEKFIGTIRNITFQKKIEQELKVSEEKYRLLFNNSPVGIGLSTIEGKVFDSNETMVELTGYSAEDLNNTGVTSIYAEPNVRSKIIKALQEEGNLHDYEVKLRRKDNTEFFGSVSYDLIELSGKKIIQTSLRDITKSKNAELELIKLNNLKSELLRRTSHELKTPLVSIKGFSDLLLKVHRDKLDSLVISILNEIKQGCLRLENLIADILKTSELESGTIQLHPSEEDLSFLIRLCVKEMKGLSILRNITINLELPERLITQFEKEQVHQVVSNLLNNSVKYTPPGGLIEIKSEIKNEFIITSIKDNGIGISDEDKERIFKQFGKVERYGQGLDIISEGSGLGLFISKKVIELHGGKIWVESEGKNKGSTFYFSLPLIEKF